MPKHIRKRIIIISLLIIAALICILPSVAPNLPQGWKKILPNRGIHLGLDLQGGVQLILKVDIEQAVLHQLELSANDLIKSLNADQISAGTIEPIESGHLRFRLPDASDISSVMQRVTESFPTLEIEAGKEGYIDLSFNEEERNTIKTNALDQCLETISNRIYQLGVEEPVIVPRGSDEIVVQLAGIEDPQRAIEIIGRVAQLEFKLVDANQPTDLMSRYQDALQSGRLKPNYTHQELNQVFHSVLTPGTEVYMKKNTDPATGRVETVPILLEKSTLMTGDALKTSRVAMGEHLAEPYVGLTFNSAGANLFERITRKNVGRQLAIVLDDIVQSAPLIQKPISGGKAQITGSFTIEEAHDLALVLRAGALPASMKIAGNLTVGPSLGQDSIRAGLSSTILGGALVLLFMVIYYRLSGVIANIALILNLILMAAALSLFRATLTLPGIAGIVLSIGMAVDSNVLIFERMREESALGKPVYASVQAGYGKALWTIIDSHVTTLITAGALFLFGTGRIKGFAVTLSIGVIFNLFTALYGTRVFYDYLHFKKRLKSFRFLHILEKSNIDFIGFRKAAFALSGILVLLGFFAFVQIELGKANLSVELSGGAMIQFKAEEAFGLDEVRSVLVASGMQELELQEAPDEKLLMVRAKTVQESAGDVAERVAAALNQALPEKHFSLELKADIGASESRDMKKAALVAIVVSMTGIIVYLGWRFNRTFGVAAAIATFHDVLAVLGIFHLMGKEISLLVITALLTLAGYSLTDTVVVFDRIRENMRSGNRQGLRNIINKSINEVLGRTIVTTGTVMLVLIALLFMGGPILHDFTLALLIGVMVGTYSSVLVASPIVFIWQRGQA